MSNFHIGQEVVCVAERFNCLESDLTQDVVKGNIYTINYMENYRGELHLGFEETNQNACYRHDGFAPLQTKSEEEDMNEAIEEALSQPAFQ